MLVKFLKPYSIFKAGETADMMKSKAKALKAEGVVTDDPFEIRGFNISNLGVLSKTEEEE